MRGTPSTSRQQAFLGEKNRYRFDPVTSQWRFDAESLPGDEPTTGRGSSAEGWRSEPSAGRWLLLLDDVPTGGDELKSVLEQLGRLKLLCRSLFCLAKIEELERAEPADITRSLNAAALMPPPPEPDGGAPPPPAGRARDVALARMAAAAAAVEREWRAWFDKAQTALGAVNAAARPPGAAAGWPPPLALGLGAKGGLAAPPDALRLAAAGARDAADARHDAASDSLRGAQPPPAPPPA